MYRIKNKYTLNNFNFNSPSLLISLRKVSTGITQPANSEIKRPPNGINTLDVALSNRSKKVRPKIVTSFQTPNDNDDKK